RDGASRSAPLGAVWRPPAAHGFVGARSWWSGQGCGWGAAWRTLAASFRRNYTIMTIYSNILDMVGHTPMLEISKFDTGRYGQIVGTMIWKKLDRLGGFILPESMLDVRDYCQKHHLQPAPELTLKKMKKIVNDDFGADIAIWGSVERVPGTKVEIYDLVIKCVDFSVQPEPKTIYQSSRRTNSVSEIPHLYVKQLLDALYKRPSNNNSPLPLGERQGAMAEAKKNWRQNPNLIINGDFQIGTGGTPKGWAPVAGIKREPLGKLVNWTFEAGNPANKIVCFNFDSTVGDNEGVMYYSDWFPVEEGAKYRFQCRWRTSGPNVKVFIKCYDDLTDEYRNEPGKDPLAKSLKSLDEKNPCTHFAAGKSIAASRI
ncbi:MAG: hypothetical protein ACWGMZ_12105, partial [Thermoguttaceae bacterium]